MIIIETNLITNLVVLCRCKITWKAVLNVWPMIQKWTNKTCNTLTQIYMLFKMSMITWKKLFKTRGRYGELHSTGSCSMGQELGTWEKPMPNLKNHVVSVGSKTLDVFQYLKNKETVMVNFDRRKSCQQAYWHQKDVKHIDENELELAKKTMFFIHRSFREHDNTL